MATSMKIMSKEEEMMREEEPVTDSDWSEEEEEEGEEEEEEEEENNDYDWDGFPKNECYYRGVESDEEIITDSIRNEVDCGYRFVVKEGFTVTKPRRPQKTYIPRSNKFCRSVLHIKTHPLSALSKLALTRYNDIRGTNYKYIGLVKAYKSAVGGFIFRIRFKAALPAQPQIDFQAIIYQATPDRPKPGTKTRDVAVDIQFVYPLP